MTVSQKVIKETAEMLKAEYEFQHDMFERMQAVVGPNSIDTHKSIMGMDMAGYFARQMAHIFRADNPAFDEKKFFKLCGMDWLS